LKTLSNLPTLSEQIIAFADLRDFHRKICRSLTQVDLFEFLSRYYSLVESVIEPTDGRIIKFIGDAVLLIFPASNPGHALDTLRKLKAGTDLFLSQTHAESRLCIKAHIGTVATGMVGKGELERFDIFGLAVNEAALLPQGEWVLSDELQKRAAVQSAQPGRTK